MNKNKAVEFGIFLTGRSEKEIEERYDKFMNNRNTFRCDQCKNVYTDYDQVSFYCRHGFDLKKETCQGRNFVKF